MFARGVLFFEINNLRNWHMFSCDFSKYWIVDLCYIERPSKVFLTLRCLQNISVRFERSKQLNKQVLFVQTFFFLCDIPRRQYLMIVSLVTIFSRRLERSLRCGQLVGRRAKLRGRAVRTLSTYWIIQVRRVVRILRVARCKILDYDTRIEFHGKIIAEAKSFFI